MSFNNFILRRHVQEEVLKQWWFIVKNAKEIIQKCKFDLINHSNRFMYS